MSDTIINSSQPPTVPARKVEVLKPSLLLTQEHQMCPGCGEPLAAAATASYGNGQSVMGRT